MSRLLFAAARGARVQCEEELLSGKTVWEDTPVQWGMDNELRIHPDDAHLQYGSVSTEMRKAAEKLDLYYPDVMVEQFGFFHSNVSDALAFAYSDDDFQRSMFLLILAEALADEGL